MVLSESTTSENTKKESPDYVRTSLAAAMTLKLMPGRFYRDAKLYCINLLLLYSDGCKANCAYCGLSRERAGLWEEKSFIRVTWPTYSLNEIIERMVKYQNEIKRVCISMITHKKAVEDTAEVSRRIKEKLNIPISALITPTIMNKGDLIKLKEAGVDHIGVAVDAARPDLFDKFRGKGVRGPHRWEKYWGIVKDAVEIFGDTVGVHLIVGLGETEEEMIKTIQDAQDLGVSTHLFSFYPEENSLMHNYSPPPIEQYRHIQIARYLINNKISRIEDMKFDSNGVLKAINISKKKLDEIIESGLPFMTSGFANERPSEVLRNYPFIPNKSDIKLIKKQFNLECLG
ncbi:MAG: radical SAM protein [Candidatus Odinarchaeia archaeon]